MNLAFRFPASLSVTFGQHAVSGDGGYAHFESPNVFGGRGGAGEGRGARENKWPFSVTVLR